MSYDRDQFLAVVSKKRDELMRASLPQAREMHAAAVSMSLLTNDPQWDRYNSLLQGMRDRVQARKEEAERKQADPTVWASEALFKLKSDVLCADYALGVLDTILALPKALHEGGEKAQEIIHKFEGADGTEDPQS
jgi:hypothetical protein